MIIKVAAKRYLIVAKHPIFAIIEENVTFRFNQTLKKDPPVSVTKDLWVSTVRIKQDRV